MNRENKSASADAKRTSSAEEKKMRYLTLRSTGVPNSQARRAVGVYKKTVER